MESRMNAREKDNPNNDQNEKVIENERSVADRQSDPNKENDLGAGESKNLSDKPNIPSGALPKRKKKRDKFLTAQNSINRRIGMCEDDDEAHSATYPTDCYSFLSLHGPTSGYFWFGLMVYAFQMSFLLLMILSVVNQNWRTGKVDDNPWDGGLADLIVTEVSPLLRGAQCISLLTFVLFADSSTMDIITAVHTFPAFSLAVIGDNVFFAIVSCFLRFTQGLFATAVAVILVLTSANVIEVILNFTALNFISALDDIAFEFAKQGRYGPKLEKEAKRIEHLPLPVCMFRRHKHLRFWYTVIPLGICVFGCFFTVVAWQEHSYRWETHILRIQFKEDTSLQAYNGCYRNDFDRKEETWRRDFYVSDEYVDTKAQFGFCIEKHQWYLYEGNESNPCDADYAIHSSSTDTFDISAVFLDDWFTSSHTTAELYFFEDEYDGQNLHCDEFLNNGKCDDNFNNAFNSFDSGDCCAHTCMHSTCGIGGLIKPFGYANTTGDGYSNCIDPAMVPLTIHLDGFTSSHDPEFLELSEENRTYIEKYLPDFYEIPPTDTYLSLYCDGTKVFKCHVNRNMENQTETVKVNDGASCDIRIENTTSSKPKWDDEPIWYVNYTVYNGNNIVDRPILLQDYSYNKGVASFNMIPNCYFDMLSDHIDSRINLDVQDSPSSKAINWLMENEATFSGCRYYLVSRYALSVMNFAAPMNSPTSSGPEDNLWIEKDMPDLCSWQNIVCERNLKSPDVDLLHLDISGLAILGHIAPEIGLLTNLDLFDAHDNTLTSSIPTDIGLLISLELCDIHNNMLTGTIPTEIGLMTSLTVLNIGANRLTGNIPSEIGLLTNLSILDLSDNGITGTIPSEIGLLTSLTRLSLDKNFLTGSIPSEISLTSLSIFEVEVYPAVESIFKNNGLR